MYASPLQLAMHWKNMEMIKLLIEHDAPVIKTYGGSMTTLGFVLLICFPNQGDKIVTDEVKAIIKYFLLELKVDPYEMYWVSLNKSTVLEISIIQMASSLFEFFLECGISVDRLAYSSLPDNQKFDVRGALINYRLKPRFEHLSAKNKS